MARLYILNQDDDRIVTWDFKSPEWFQRALASWPSPASLPVWAGFLNGVQIMMARQEALRKAWDLGPIVYEPLDPED